MYSCFQILLRVVRKSRGFPIFVFYTIIGFFEGVNEVPPPPPPMCTYFAWPLKTSSRILRLISFLLRLSSKFRNTKITNWVVTGVWVWISLAFQWNKSYRQFKSPVISVKFLYNRKENIGVISVVKISCSFDSILKIIWEIWSHCSYI